ncbi:NAD(P)H-dependent flavin oxidoreductase [Noviherbaspirillum aerium]|uniref:NAD(P)H-dependent flavin oxidoreductase n=1 Tax=Noviherbaspirillum aerium TaxID=2588497 RepID=UPI00124C882A|nr:nitronate monooxygenase [Noviherbaspirillum aerium]
MNLQELFGISLPIIQAPMAGAQGSALAVAVCKAGGLGSLPCAMLSADDMRKELAAIRAQTDAPFNVNFFCHTQPDVDAEREALWRKTLSPYYAEFGVDSSTIATGSGRMPFDAQAAEILDEFRPRVVSFHFGLPNEQLLDRVKSCGAKILSSATTVEEALWLEARGVDAIIAQGLEAGGHRGMFLTDDLTTQMGTFALLRQVIQEVKVPVIAAGGIADAKGVAGAMALGAAGVQIGTAYLLCPETKISAVHRSALASSGARHTALTNIFSGRPARGIVNRAIREIGPINAQVPPFPMATSAIAPLRAKAESSGSGDFSPLWSGQNPSGCKPIPAYDLTQILAAEVSPNHSASSSHQK